MLLAIRKWELPYKEVAELLEAGLDPNPNEATNAFLWREKDATKNAMRMAARSFYPHKQLHSKTSSEMQEMIFRRGQNFNDYPAFFRRGTFVRRITEERPFTPEEFARIPEKHRPSPETLVPRSRDVEIDMPVFTNVRNWEAIIFEGAAPEVD